MNTSTAVKLKRVSSLSLQAGVSLLLFLYLAAFLLPQGSAPHVHVDQALHESDACKTDACHIAIYHPGNSTGCHHKFHFTKAQAECLLCHSILTRHIPIQIALPEELVCATSYFSPLTIVGEVASATIFHDDRGPPFDCIL